MGCKPRTASLRILTAKSRKCDCLKARGEAIATLSRYYCYSCQHVWRASSSEEIGVNVGFKLGTTKCPECGSSLFEERFPDGAIMKPYVPKRCGFCALCGEKKASIKITELDGKLYWICSECNEEHPRSGKYSFSEESSGQRRDGRPGRIG